MNNMKQQSRTIHIIKEINTKYCIDSAHGEIIGNIITSHWNNDYVVVLDFADTDIILASFINAIYNIISRDNKIENIRQKLTFINLNKTELSEIKRCERILFIHNEKDEDLLQSIELLTNGK